MAYAVIQSQDGYKYQLTSDDVLWAARMAVGEGPGPAATLWSMTQRAVLLDVGQPGTRYYDAYPTFTEFIRAYSQPINPRWLDTGDRCRARTTNMCSPSRIARRRWHQGASWSELEARDPEAVALTKQWSKAKLPNPVPRSVDFADFATTEDDLAAGDRLIATYGTCPSCNRYITSPGSINWPENYVTMVPGSGLVAGLLWGGAFGGALLAGYLWWENR